MPDNSIEKINSEYLKALSEIEVSVTSIISNKNVCKDIYNKCINIDPYRTIYQIES